MLKCTVCGAVFDEEDTINIPNYVPYGDRYVLESQDSGCPICQSIEIENYEEEE